jgi:hypothetical protein
LFADVADESVGACVCKDERRLAVGIRFNNIPNLCVESVFSAVEGVVSVILVKLDLYTDQPCVQVYTGNMINVNDPSFKNGVKQYTHCAVCLETQAMPDSINHPGFTNTVLKPGEKYDTTTTFAFFN